MKTILSRRNARRVIILSAMLALAIGVVLSCATPSVEMTSDTDVSQTDGESTSGDSAASEELSADSGEDEAVSEEAPDAAANTLPDTAEATDIDSEPSAESTDGEEESETAASDEATDAEAADASNSESAQVASVSDELHKGMTVGFTEEGFAFRGSPDAPIVLYEYSDYQCPFCGRHTQQVEPALNDSYVMEGEVRIVFRDFPLTSIHPNAVPAAAAALCAADTSANAFWEMHDSLFDTQSEWSSLENPSEYFASLGEEIGLDADALTACIESDAKSAQIAASAAEAQALGYNSTPSFQLVNTEANVQTDLIGAQPFENFVSYIDSLATGEVPCGLPDWACADGLAPDPDRPGITMAGDFYQGDPNAETVVIEFSDFQCGFCRRHAQETQPLLDEEFVETGDIYWVFKHFPALGPASQEGAIAAECAAYQGEFEQMKNTLFERTDWSRGDSTTAFIEMATEIGLDEEQFASCLEDEATAQNVAEDYAEGQNIVRGTPTFIVLQGEQGQLIQGAQPYERFSELLTIAVEEGLPQQ